MRYLRGKAHWNTSQFVTAVEAERTAQAKEAKRIEFGAKLAEFSTYELLFELISRIKKSNGLESVGTLQLTIVGRACFEEMSRRLQRVVREAQKEKAVKAVFK